MPDREHDGESLANIIVQIYENQNMTALQLNTIQLELKEFMRAFPLGDVHGHRMYHEALIRKEEEKRAAWQNIRTKTLGGLLVLALTSAATWVWTHIGDILKLVGK